MKNPEMQKAIDKFQRMYFGIGTTEARERGICVTCKGSATSFSTDICRREYEISGMCESCQKDVYRIPNPEQKENEKENL